MRKNKLLILIVLALIVIFITTITLSFYLSPSIEPDNISYSLTEPEIKLLGTTSYGSVSRMGPYGNTKSPIKIAYITGVHPLEYKSHQAIIKTILEHDKSFKYSYYIYTINVTEDAEIYNKGRMNGQLLANKYVVADIKKENFDLVIDVHSNKGGWEKTWFIFSPIKGDYSETIAQNIKNNISWLTYYNPPNPTSPEYVTIPLIKSGIPAIIYEIYTYDSDIKSKEQADEFVSVVDNITI